MGVGMSELLLGHIVKNISCLVQREVFQGIFFQILHGFNHFLIAVSQLLGGGGAYPRRPHVCMYVNLSAVVQSNQILKPMVVKIDKELNKLVYTICENFNDIMKFWGGGGLSPRFCTQLLHCKSIRILMTLEAERSRSRMTGMGVGTSKLLTGHTVQNVSRLVQEKGL